MIDISKMKALADRLATCADDCYEGLLSGFGADFNAGAEAIRSLLSELEAREADRRDAERYRWIRSEVVPFKAYASGNPNWTFSGYGPRGATFDEAIAAAIEERQGKGS